MASISRRGKLWQTRISYKNHLGEFKIKNKSGFKTKRAAEIYSTSVENDIANGILPDDKKISHEFAEYFYTWYQDFKEAKISKRTQQRYLITYHELQNYFGDKQIENITRRDYQKFITDYGKAHAKDTVQKVNSLIRACVRNAIYEDILIKDFTSDVELVYNKDKSRKIEYLNMTESKKLTSYLLEKCNHYFTSNQMILTAIFTGMRLGEIQGLKWENINFNFKTITVNHAYNESTHEDIPTKTKSSIRVIRINSTLVDVLRHLRESSRNNYVFTNQYEAVPTSAAVNKTLRAALKALNIERKAFHFHSLRHTHVAYLLACGVDIYPISKRLGHADLGTTTRVYSYLIDEYKAKTDVQIEGFLDNLTEAPKADKTRKIN